jgi:hypothetical protein
VGGSVEATDDDTVSVVLALDTGRVIVSKTDIPKEVTTTGLMVVRPMGAVPGDGLVVLVSAVSSNILN